jgi:O-acetyl-ADP-ribose deacetylase (regulator of RNase III)
MNKINYVIGDATQPQGEGKKIICHICNNKNRWGVGFVLALSKRWVKPEIHYRQKDSYVLGDVDIIQVEDDVYVANMIGQHGTDLDENDNPPIRYDAVKEALFEVNSIANAIGATIHCPRFGTGLAGGSWEVIENIIKEVITVDITVYDLK